MSDAQASSGWGFTVPATDAELLAELRRHGVRPGRHLQVTVGPENTGQPEEPEAEPAGPRRLSFAGSIHAEPDLSERVDDYLAGFGQA